jgi:hypothetical protein
MVTIAPLPLSTGSANAAAFPVPSARYQEGKLTFLCACDVDTTKPAPLSSFDVKVDGVSNPVTSFVVLGWAIMTLLLTSPVYSGSVITFSYNAPPVDNTLNNNAFQDEDGVDFDSFTWEVTNMGGARPAPNTPSWDKEPLTDSETDSNTVGYMPTTSPGTIIITDEFGFTLDKNNGIKPKIRMKNYAGRIKMSISAKYKVGAKNVTYKCAFAPFGTIKKIKTAKWRWYSPKKACVLPAPLVTAIRANKATLSTSGKWTRQALMTGKKVRADKTTIKARNLKYKVKAKP